MPYDMPQATREGIKAYVEKHQAQGGFLTAVFANDLFLAVVRADQFNMNRLKEIVYTVHEETPPECRGSFAAVEAWVNKRVAT